MLSKAIQSSLKKFATRGSTVRVQIATFMKRSAAKTDSSGPKTMGYVKPIVFASAFGLTTYVGCAIWEFELNQSKLKKRAKGLRDLFDDDESGGLYGGPWFKGWYEGKPSQPTPKRGELRQKANSWWNSLTVGQKTVLSIIAVNTGVLVFLRVALANPALAAIAQKYFLLSPTSSLTSLIGSTFSHYSFFHFGMNMYVLWTLSPFAQVMGQQQFTAFYITSGVFANVASIIYRQLPFHPAAVASLGASGCLYAVVGALCIKFPHVQFGVPLLSDIFPTLHFKAEALWPGLLTFDLVGLLLGFRMFDHIAHMSGLLFGVWYAKWGDHWLWSRHFRHSVVENWRRIRQRKAFDD